MTQELLAFSANDSGAWINPRGNRRYLLWRVFNPQGKTVAFVMLNPSDADAKEDDPTLRRCIGYAKTWGYGRLLVVNLFSVIGSDPKALKLHEQPDLFGDRVNEAVLEDVLTSADLVVCAWGAHTRIGHVSEQLLALARNHRVELHRLDSNADGSPTHPLFLSKELRPEKWDPTQTYRKGRDGNEEEAQEEAEDVRAQGDS
jgi:hypothetical protein